MDLRSSVSFLFCVSTLTPKASSVLTHQSKLCCIFLSAASSLTTEQRSSFLKPSMLPFIFLTSWPYLRSSVERAFLRPLSSSLSYLSSCSNLLNMDWTSPLSFLISSSSDFLSSAWLSVMRLSSAACWTFYSLSSLHSCSNLARFV